MACADIAGGVGESHALFAPRIVACKLLSLGNNGQIRTPMGCCQPEASHGQLFTETLHGCGLQAHFNEALGVSKGEWTANLGFTQNTLFVHLHGTSHGSPHADGVHAHLIADVIGLGEGCQVADTAVAAKSIDGLILGAFPFPPIGAFRNPGDTSTCDGTTETGGRLHQKFLGKGLSTDIFPFFKCALLKFRVGKTPAFCVPITVTAVPYVRSGGGWSLKLSLNFAT